MKCRLDSLRCQSSHLKLEGWSVFNLHFICAGWKVLYTTCIWTEIVRTGCCCFCITYEVNISPVITVDFMKGLLLTWVLFGLVNIPQSTSFLPRSKQSFLCSSCESSLLLLQPGIREEHAFCSRCSFIFHQSCLPALCQFRMFTPYLRP